MKKLLHISFTFFLAVVLVIMGSGVQLSPTTQMQPTVFDFHAFQPLMAIIHEWQMPHLSFMAKRTLSNIIPKTGYSPPPKLYLYLIEVLTI